MAIHLIRICSFVVLFFIVGLIIVDLEVSQLIGIPGGGDNTKPISKIVLLQVFLCQILEVPLREGKIGRQIDLGLGSLQNDIITEVASLTTDLDPLLQILLEIGTIHDAILNGMGTIDHQLDLVLLTKLFHTLAFTLQGLLARSFGGHFLLSCRSESSNIS